ncbi:hypothetical protein BDW75DRAFT_242942 [Aspergillus navahoensis]
MPRPGQARWTLLTSALSFTFDNIVDNEAANCWNLVGMVGELILWNPSLAENGTGIGRPATIATNSVTLTIACNPYEYPCTLSESISYCVAEPTGLARTDVFTA